MNDNARAWVAALRSGEYKQGQVYLNRRGEYCCLGVACELYLGAGNDLEKTVYRDIGNGAYVIYDYDAISTFLPDSVREWLGLADASGSFAYLQESLANLNDTGKTFLEIADIIESEPEGLFE